MSRPGDSTSVAASATHPAQQTSVVSKKANSNSRRDDTPKKRADSVQLTYSIPPSELRDAGHRVNAALFISNNNNRYNGPEFIKMTNAAVKAVTSIASTKDSKSGTITGLTTDSLQRLNWLDEKASNAFNVQQNLDKIYSLPNKSREDQKRILREVFEAIRQAPLRSDTPKSAVDSKAWANQNADAISTLEALGKDRFRFRDITDFITTDAYIDKYIDLLVPVIKQIREPNRFKSNSHQLDGIMNEKDRITVKIGNTSYQLDKGQTFDLRTVFDQYTQDSPRDQLFTLLESVVPFGILPEVTSQEHWGDLASSFPRERNAFNLLLYPDSMNLVFRYFYVDNKCKLRMFSYGHINGKQNNSSLIPDSVDSPSSEVADVEEQKATAAPQSEGVQKLKSALHQAMTESTDDDATSLYCNMWNALKDFETVQNMRLNGHTSHFLLGLGLPLPQNFVKIAAWCNAQGVQQSSNGFQQNLTMMQMMMHF